MGNKPRSPSPAPHHPTQLKIRTTCVFAAFWFLRTRGTTDLIGGWLIVPKFWILTSDLLQAWLFLALRVAPGSFYNNHSRRASNHIYDQRPRAMKTWQSYLYVRMYGRCNVRWVVSVTVTVMVMLTLKVRVTVTGKVRVAKTVKVTSFAIFRAVTSASCCQ